MAPRRALGLPVRRCPGRGPWCRHGPLCFLVAAVQLLDHRGRRNVFGESLLHPSRVDTNATRRCSRWSRTTLARPKVLNTKDNRLMARHSHCQGRHGGNTTLTPVATKLIANVTTHCVRKAAVVLEKFSGMLIP